MQSDTGKNPTLALQPTEDRAGQQLYQDAAAFMKDYPDIRALAYEAARTIIHKHTGRTLDPTTVYWHRFKSAMNSPRTFTGWQHSGRPHQSLTLIELVMHRFDAADQDAPDELDLYGGFYTVGPDEQAYDEHNEVPMLPRQVLRDFWKMDFAAACKLKVEVFWHEHAERFSLLAKTRLLSCAGLALSHRQMTPQDFQTVLMAVTGGTDSHVTMAMLQAGTSAADGVSIRLFELAGKPSRNTLCISTRQGQRILYCPDEQPAFVCFNDDLALARWVKAQLADPTAKAALVSRFMRDEAGRASFATMLSGLGDRALDQQRVAPTVSTDVFSQLRDRARQEMREDVHQQLTSNASLRKQMWIGYLGAFIQVFGAFAPIGWPLALSMVGAGIASVGLNIDQAVNGRTPRLRKAGVVGAILNSVYLLLNLPLLTDLRRPVSALPVEVEVEVGVEDQLVSLDSLEGDALLEDAPADPRDSRYRGVHVMDNGDTWIRLNGRPFRVQHVEDLNLWYIVSPQEPFSFRGAQLVRLNDADQWELVAAPGLKGGMEGAAHAGDAVRAVARPFETVSSDFWDVYMQFNLPEEQRLSALGNQRQASVIDVYDAEHWQILVADTDGESVVMDRSGEIHRVFRAGNDWHGGVIPRYTQDEDAYNIFLRTGMRMGRDQIGALSRLVEDLSEIAPNNDVALYRGGSGQRGTSGQAFRDGRFKPGDVLVNTDITSFSENPYIARVFSSSQGGAASDTFHGSITFDDTSVVFELPERQYLSATPISPFSVSPEEVESVFVPGNYFEIQRIQEVAGNRCRFVNVKLKQITPERVAGAVYDMRTGLPFSREHYAARLGPDAKGLMDRFFPLKP